ncbi:glycosyltransferase family 4 protein [Candidatus Nomurabacteria bacterium]|nr:glycosyltransferase family 4 protein [Candidatus Nomurabacteria bacterium]
MRILFLITKSTEGGAQTHIFQLCRALKKEGHDVAVMSSPGGWLEFAIKDLGGIFISNDYFKNSYSFLNFLKSKKIILNTVDSFDPDIVSCHSGIAGIFGRLSILNKKPTIFTAHGWSFGQGSPFLQKIITYPSELLASHFCKKIICVSKYDLNLAIKLKVAPLYKLINIHNGAEIPSEKPLIRESLKSIIFVGRLSNQKKPELLLNALNILPKDIINNIIVYIVGDGPNYDKLNSLVIQNDLNEKVIFMGALSRLEILSFLEKNDLFILPTKQEGLPRSILEAISKGLPVIASDVGGVSEIVTSDIGFLLKKNTAQELAEYIEYLYKNPNILTCMSQNAFLRAKNNFSLEKMIQETIQIYKEIIND